jgi:acetoin utilization deacetylase AcuC-like enzyme
MILYCPGNGLPLRELGILIPIAPDRVGPVLKALRAHPVLGPRESEWLMGPDGSTITRDDLLRVNTPRYVDQIFGDGVDSAIIKAFELVDDEGNYHRYDPARATLPLRKLFEQSLRGIAGTYQCGKEALSRGFCFHCGGGSHHGHPDFGHGFCILNDSATAIRRLQAEGRITTAWVIDVDVHKGDGTAAMMTGDSSVTTLSVHMANGWPLDNPEFDSDGNRHPSFTPSDIDVPVDVGEEAHYLPRLEKALLELDARDAPDIAYVLAGADPYEKDGLESTGQLNLTLEQMNERNLMIYEFLKDRNIPQAWLMAGGYGERAWEPYPSILTYALLDRLPPAG